MTNQMKAFLYLAFTTLAFSSMELVGKMVAGHLTPLQVTFWRFFIGLIILIPFALYELKRRNLRLTVKDLGWLALLGICNIALAMVLLQVAVTMIPASLAAIIISSNPIFVVIFASFILNEKITTRTVMGLVLGILGLSLVTNVFNSVAQVNLLGLASGVGAALFFGLYTVLSKKIVGKLGGMITNAGSFSIGSLLLLVILLLKGEPIFHGINSMSIGPLLYLGLIVTGFAYICFLRGLSLVDASKGSVIFFFKPGVAAILAFLILHEHIGMNMILGTALVICGSVFMLQKTKTIKKTVAK